MMQLGHWKKPLMHGSAVFLLFCTAYTVLFFPRIFEGSVNISGDVFAYYLPVFLSPRSLWTNLLYGGFPSLADPQFQLWYPINRWFALFPHTWECFTISAYVLASSFTYGYVYCLTQSRLAAVISGLVYGMGGFTMAHWGYSSILHATAWIPLLIWALEQLRAKLSGFWLMVGSAAVACILLAGHPQIAFYGLGLGAVYALVFGYTAPIGRWRCYRAACLMVVFAVGLTAIQLLPTLEFAQLSVRAQMTFAEFANPAFSLPQLVQLVFPHYNPPQANGLGMMSYVGLLTPLFAIFGGVTAKHQGHARFWLCVALIGLCLALGNAIPLAQLTYHLPIYNKFRAPVRNLLVVGFAMSVLAGFGVARLQRNDISSRLFRRGALLGLAIVTVSLAMVLRWGLLTYPWYVIALPIGLWSIGFGLLIGCQRSRSPQQRQSLMLLLLCVMVLDLTSFSWLDHRYPGGFNWLGHRTIAAKHRQYLVPSAMVEKYKSRLRTTHQRMLPMRGANATYQGSLEDIPPNTSLFWGVPSASGYGPLILSRYDQLLAFDWLGAVPEALLSPRNRTLDILAVKYIFSRPLPDPPRSDTQRWQRQAAISDSTVVYENRQVLPRTWLVAETIPLSPEQVLATIQTSRLPDGRVYEPEKMALVEDPQMRFKSASRQPAETMQILDMTDTRVRVQTQTTAPQFLVLSDVFYPGWVATIDGRRAEVVQTNYVLRGVAVPAGQHVIECRFEPCSFRWGAGITLAAFCGETYWLLRRQRQAPTI
jgi:hypothetical protein